MIQNQQRNNNLVKTLKKINKPAKHVYAQSYFTNQY